MIYLKKVAAQAKSFGKGLGIVEEISRHIFNFIYIISFFLGIAVITLNGILNGKKKTPMFPTLQVFHVSLFIHILANFIYFYKAYFISLWEIRILIFTIINITLVLFIYFGIDVLSKISAAEDKRKKIVLYFGGFYIVVYSFIRAIHMDVDTAFHGWAHTLLFIGSNLLFTCIAGFFCCRFYCRGRNVVAGSPGQVIFRTLAWMLPLYLIFNFSVDVCFGMITDRITIWSINIYHLSSLLYFILNLILLLTYYRREFFGQEGPGAEDGPRDPVGEGSMSLDQAAKRYRLTARERELVELVYQGHSTPEIADMLSISGNTVKRHLTNIYRKMEIKNRIELIRLLKG